MILRSLETANFRNLREAKIEFHPAANIFVGDNGQGKTNLLEAIYFLATTRSFRTSRVGHLARIGAPHLFVEGEIVGADGLVRTQSVGLTTGVERRRELLVNGRKTTLHDYLGRLQVFAYSAARLAILRGGPEERRRFLDRGIASLRPAYLAESSRYNRVVKQRNALLPHIAEGKRRASELDAWDRELVEAALPVARARRIYAEAVAARAWEILEAHRYHLRQLRFVYRPNGFEEGIEAEAGLAALRRLRRRELGAGFTLWGPHRDSLEVLAGEEPAAEILSSGETKMTVLFLKLAKVDLYRREREESPIFLLDDVDAELDLGIIERLLSYSADAIQRFTTSPKDAFFERFSIGPNRRFAVAEGGVSAVAEE
ncbi:MAG TPA: DNA replication and repair protein RecF [Thermoanaerobaculia bacterium]|nr:DNA replication and repair protein RecF [Thermoanaerobaculia bacterium]